MILAVPGMIAWVFFTESAVQWLGFDEATAEIAQSYAYPYLAVMTFDGISECLHEFLDIMDHEKYSTMFAIFGYILETAVVVVMALAGWKDLVLIGIVQAFLSFLMLVLNFALVLYKGWLDDYWEGFAVTFGLAVSTEYVYVDAVFCSFLLVVEHCRIEKRYTLWLQQPFRWV